jgi:hypothetical protein
MLTAATLFVMLQDRAGEKVPAKAADTTLGANRQVSLGTAVHTACMAHVEL